MPIKYSLRRHRNYCDKFDFRRENCCHRCLDGYKNQDENRYGFENKEEEINEKVAKHNGFFLILPFC